MFDFSKFKLKYLISIILFSVTIIGSVILINNDTWLTRSISYFGTQPETETFFNIGVVVTGVSLAFLVLEIFKAFNQLYREGKTNKFKQITLTALFIIFVIFILNVGIFPVHIHRLIHDLSTHTFTLLFIILFFTIGFFLPVTKSFKLNSFILGILSLTIIFLFILKVITFLGMTIFFFVIFFSWIYQFGFELNNILKE